MSAPFLCIEEYGNGYVIAEYGSGVRYIDKGGKWRSTSAKGLVPLEKAEAEALLKKMGAVHENDEEEPPEPQIEQIHDLSPKREVGIFAVLSDKFEFAPHALIIKGHPTFEQCESAAKSLVFFGKNVRVWFGDLLTYMEFRWGEKYAQVLEATGFSYQYVANTISVIRRVPPEVRPRQGSYFSHYEKVASLPAPQQQRLLAQAVKKGWTTADLGLEVKKVKRKQENQILPIQVKLQLTLSLYVPEDKIGKLKQLAQSWASRLKVHDMELIDDVEIKRIS